MTMTSSTTPGLPVDPSARRPGILGRHFMLRIAGLAIEDADGLRCPDTASWAEAVADGEDRLRARGAQVSELLHEAIGGLEDGQARRGLVNLRRDIFGNRRPRDPAAAQHLAAGLGGEAGRAAGNWLRDREQTDHLSLSGPGLLAAETIAARARLRTLAGDPRLRQGLLLASPGLDRYMSSYTATGTGGLSKRQRRIERSLLEYVYRAAGKTSPFSSFTGVALGEFTAPGPGPSLAATVADQWPATQRINVAILGRLAGLIVNNPELRNGLPVALTSGWALDADRIRYVRREISAGDNETTVSFDAVRESLFFLRASGTLQTMVTVLGQTPGITYRELVTALARDDQVVAAEYDRYLSILLRLGLLQVPVLQLDIHSGDPLLSFRASLISLGHPWAAEAAAQLDGPIAAMKEYAQADVLGRRELLAGIRRDLTALAQRLGGPSAELPQALLFEDCRAADTVLGIDGEFWSARVGDSLRSLSRLLPAFDLMLPHRLTLKGFFVSRYGQGGRCDSLLSLVQDPNLPLEFDTAEGMRIRVVAVTRELEYPWGATFLPDGTMLVTERAGRLRIIRNGVLDPNPVEGGPACFFAGESGLPGAVHGYMDVALHPRFAENHFLYLTYTKPLDEKRRVAALARGVWNGRALTGTKDIFVADGGGPSRIAFGRDGTLYITVSGNKPGDPQNPDTDGGKVLRLNDDGSIPKDNPFVGQAGHKPEVYTLGHRNSLGLAMHPGTGEIWQNENGPNGGDEINILKPGRNYGWPIVSYGRTYQGPWQSERPRHEGFEAPVVFWMPAIAVSGMAFYTGDKLPKWKGDVFVGSLRTGEIPGTGHLERILFNEKMEELRRESLLTELRQRIRDVRQGPDGLLYVLTDEKPGAVLRIEPAQ